VNLVSDVTRAYFNVAGTTAEEINASLLANAPVDSRGQKALGLTSYRVVISGTKCSLPASCAIGRYTIGINARITLPLLTTAASIDPALSAAWTAFADTVSVHEDRHVTIAVEAMEEVKRQLLALDPKPNCAEVDHAVDIVWRLANEAMDRRQQAFHTADRQGQAGVVVR
jgi:predicted secreted Zn-dependent protease